jgi:uncharacterized membrane protein YfcA
MVSAWWVLWAFLGGGFSGIMLMALLYMAGEQADQSAAVATLNRAP